MFAAVIVFVPGYALGWAVGGSGNRSWGAYVGGVLALFASSVVAIYFQAALVIGANERADGRDPTVRGVLDQAWARRGRIISWALFSTTVGIAIRALEQRLGILGRILGVLGGVAWAIASFFVVPVLIAEDLAPIAAVKRSAQLLSDVWGTSLRTTLRFGLIQLALILPTIVAIIAGIAAVATGSTIGIAVGLVLLLIGVAALIGLSMIFAAITTYARALIYRYATGRPVPGIDPHLFAGAFRTKRSRRGFA